jgi:hypothetical protein
MRRWKAWVFTAVAILGFAPQAMAKTPVNEASVHAAHKKPHSASQEGYRRGGAHLGFAPAHKPHYATLVGDPHSGLGFYQLPLKDRIGAARYHYYNQRPPWANPVRQAVIADGVHYPYYWTPTAATSYHYGVFDPNDGVGTPFFGGYYNAGTHDEDDDEPFHDFNGQPIH